MAVRKSKVPLPLHRFWLDGPKSNMKELTDKPCRIYMCGVSDSGKTTWTINFIVENRTKFQRIVVFGDEINVDSYRPFLSRNDLLVSNVDEDVVNAMYDSTRKAYAKNGANYKYPQLWIFDDRMEAAKWRVMRDLFTKGRHTHISIIFMTQGFNLGGPYATAIRDSMSHFIQFDMGASIETVKKQFFSHLYNGMELGERTGMTEKVLYHKMVACFVRNYRGLIYTKGANTPDRYKIRYTKAKVYRVKKPVAQIQAPAASTT